MSNEMSVANVSECPAASDSLNEKQLAAIDLLSRGKSYTAVAKSVDVDRRTIYRWRQKPEFAGTLEQRRLELWEEASERLRALVHPSLDVLEQQLGDPYDRARFNAATAILRMVNLRKAM
jgi:transposase-like protein